MYLVLLMIALAYVAVGLIVGLLFVFVGVGRVDRAALGSPMVFRVVILPGCVGLWPVVLLKWRGAGRSAKEGGA